MFVRLLQSFAVLLHHLPGHGKFSHSLNNPFWNNIFQFYVYIMLFYSLILKNWMLHCVIMFLLPHMEQREQWECFLHSNYPNNVKRSKTVCCITESGYQFTKDVSCYGLSIQYLSIYHTKETLKWLTKKAFQIEKYLTKYMRADFIIVKFEQVSVLYYGRFYQVKYYERKLIDNCILQSEPNTQSHSLTELPKGILSIDCLIPLGHKLNCY